MDFAVLKSYTQKPLRIAQSKTELASKTKPASNHATRVVNATNNKLTRSYLIFTALHLLPKGPFHPCDRESESTKAGNSTSKAWRPWPSTTSTTQPMTNCPFVKVKSSKSWTRKMTWIGTGQNWTDKKVRTARVAGFEPGFVFDASPVVLCAILKGFRV